MTENLSQHKPIQEDYMCRALTQTSFTGPGCCTWPCRPSWNHIGPLLKPLKVTLEGIPSLMQLN